MRRILEVFSLVLIIIVFGQSAIVFGLIWVRGSLCLYEPNWTVLAVEAVGYSVLVVYCIYRLVRLFRNISE